MTKESKGLTEKTLFLNFVTVLNDRITPFSVVTVPDEYNQQK